MADENVDLRFIAVQLGKVLDGQRETNERLQETNERLGKVEAAVSELQVEMAATRVSLSELQVEVAATRASVSEMQIALAATRVDVSSIKEDVEVIRETQQNQGARLNVMEGRLAIIEKHAGFVRA